MSWWFTTTTRYLKIFWWYLKTNWSVLATSGYYIWFSSTNRRKRKSQWGFESKYCLIYNVCCITYPRSWHRGTQPAPVRLTTDDLSPMWITCLRWPRLALSVVTSASGMCVRMSVYPTEFDTECTESDTPEGRTQPASSLLPGINLMSMWKQAMRLTDRLRRC